MYQQHAISQSIYLKAKLQTVPVPLKGPQNIVVFAGFNINWHETHPAEATSVAGFELPLPFTDAKIFNFGFGRF